MSVHLVDDDELREPDCTVPGPTGLQLLSSCAGLAVQWASLLCSLSTSIDFIRTGVCVFVHEVDKIGFK